MEKVIPQHLGIIMDGNGRWAKKRKMPRSFGHKAGFENFKKLIPYIFKCGVSYVSVFAFSTENFKRSEEEVNDLMNLFCNAVHKEKKLFEEENIKVLFSGRKEPLSDEVWSTMQELIEDTKDNTGGILNVCLNYGGQDELVDALKKMIQAKEKGMLSIEQMTSETIYHYLYQELPPLDFVIRTSGEQRISNFMLYQSAYAEYYFPETFFPDFDSKELEKAFLVFESRNRRFGGITYDEKNN